MTERDKKRQEKGTKRKRKRKRSPGLEWGFNNKINPQPNPEIPELSEEERQDTSDSDSDLELTQPSNTKKPGRKSQRNKRESVADREKELGIQKTIEETLKKDGKSGKNKAPHHKGTTSQPSKGGAPKSTDK
jgi:hypothetical protein